MAITLRSVRVAVASTAVLVAAGASGALADDHASHASQQPTTPVAAPATEAQDHGHGAPASGPAPLFDDLGTYHLAVTTQSAEAQRYFDQGMRLMWAFNLEEAERSFEEAERIDPSCAMCAWGTAFSLGPHINRPAEPARTQEANAAAQRALAKAAGVTPVERALIEAMTKRYSDPPPATPDAQAKLDQAYAEAMHGAMLEFPDDVEVATLWVESAMDVHPWDLYTPAGEPKPWTAEIVTTLEKILAKAPAHVGANHFYIHAVEGSTRPERALASAKRLETAVPGGGHLVHMPSHIYKRVGRYDDSAEWNRRAIKVDDQYRRTQNPQGFYLMYVAHNHQFLMASCWMTGQAEEALKEARATLDVMPVDMIRQMPGFDFTLGYPIWTLARFGRWTEVLAEPAPPSDFAYALAVWHAARAIANASLGKLDAAEADRDSMLAVQKAIPPDVTEGLNQASQLLGIATGLTNGVIAAKRKQTDVAVKTLEQAVALEDGLRYNEPSDWYFPVRHALGAVLLEAGRAKQAQAVYEKDLTRNPENGWALTGLANSLRAQKKPREAAGVDVRAARAWKNADTKIAGSWIEP